VIEKRFAKPGGQDTAHGCSYEANEKESRKTVRPSPIRIPKDAGRAHHET
jgi:hypothetical protein